MKKTLSIILWVLGILAVLAAVGGIAFRQGYTRGVAESPAIAEQAQNWQNQTGAVPAPYALRVYPDPMLRGGYSPFMMQRGYFGFHPLIAGLGFLFLALLFFGAMRFLFFRRTLHPYGPWRGPTPPWMQPPAPPAPAQPEPPQAENK